MIFYYPALNCQHCYPANGSRLSNAGSIYQTEHYNILYKKTYRDFGDILLSCSELPTLLSCKWIPPKQAGSPGSIYQTEYYNTLYKKPIGILVLFYYPALNCKYCYPANGSRMTCLFSTHLEFSNKA